MNCRHWILLIVTGTFLIAGCAKPSIIARHDNRDTGYFVIGLQVSPEYSLRHFDVGIALQRKNALGIVKGDPGKLTICRYSHCEDSDYKHPDRVGLVIARHLPVGNYKVSFVQAGLLERNPTGLHGLRASNLNHTFSVRKNETTYIGNFSIVNITGLGENVKVVRTANVLFSNQQSEDLQSARQKINILPDVVVNYTRLAESATGLPFVLNEKTLAGKTAPILKSAIDPTKHRYECNWGC